MIEKVTMFKAAGKLYETPQLVEAALNKIAMEEWFYSAAPYSDSETIGQILRKLESKEEIKRLHSLLQALIS